jgi:hypothetical protein
MTETPYPRKPLSPSSSGIIPASNHSLVRFKYPDDARPKIHTVMEGATYWQIIGWLVRPNGCVEPITIEGLQWIITEEAWAIVCPTGLFVEPGIGSWKSAHDWYMEVLARWQARKPAVAA